MGTRYVMFVRSKQTASIGYTLNSLPVLRADLEKRQHYVADLKAGLIAPQSPQIVKPKVE